MIAYYATLAVLFFIQSAKMMSGIAECNRAYKKDRKNATNDELKKRGGPLACRDDARAVGSMLFDRGLSLFWV